MKAVRSIAPLAVLATLALLAGCGDGSSARADDEEDRSSERADDDEDRADRGSQDRSSEADDAGKTAGQGGSESAGAGDVLAPCPTNAITLRGGRSTMTCDCSAQAIQAGSVWGSGPYTDDSNICRAAVHAGVATPQAGGEVRLSILPGQSAYQGSTMNGISSSNYGAWAGSFDFEPIDE